MDHLQEEAPPRLAADSAWAAHKIPRKVIPYHISKESTKRTLEHYPSLPNFSNKNVVRESAREAARRLGQAVQYKPSSSITLSIKKNRI
jgi:hypothetical protein